MKLIAKTLALALFILLLAMPFLPSQPFSEGRQSYRLAPGAGVVEVANSLKKEGLILSPTMFRLMARVTGKDRALKTGIYHLSPGMTPWTILARLEGGKSESLKVTIPEGYSLYRIARLLEEREICLAQDFIASAKVEGYRAHYSWLRSLPSDTSLEGYLFPDTYYVTTGTEPEALVQMMLDRFGQVAMPAWNRRGKATLSLHQALTLSSIVELEAQVPSERPLIAGVFFNRLHSFIPLGSDPTVEYALGRHQNAHGLSLKDIEVDSPYNTYKKVGLPPGPITNPGLASIKAVLHPKRTAYLYFVAKGDGSHHFSRTLEEQILAQRRIQNMVRSKP